ncbi:MAG: hypothetical protein JXJ04_19500 [Spirochaetales bacterium]|nr:hypothetical protein [Spirochaetales bacterium]
MEAKQVFTAETGCTPGEAGYSEESLKGMYKGKRILSRKAAEKMVRDIIKKFEILKTSIN